jgi:hypothetical protein
MRYLVQYARAVSNGDVKVQIMTFRTLLVAKRPAAKLIERGFTVYVSSIVIGRRGQAVFAWTKRSDPHDLEMVKWPDFIGGEYESIGA